MRKWVPRLNRMDEERGWAGRAGGSGVRGSLFWRLIRHDRAVSGPRRDAARDPAPHWAVKHRQLCREAFIYFFSFPCASEEKFCLLAGSERQRGAREGSARKLKKKIDAGGRAGRRGGREGRMEGAALSWRSN